MDQEDFLWTKQEKTTPFTRRLTAWRQTTKACLLYTSAAFAVASVRLLFALGALHFLLHGDFTVEDQIALCRLYSAEVEYSDDNMEALFDALM